MTERLEVSQAGNTIDSLQESFDVLRARARALDEEALAPGLDLQGMQAVSREATRLRDAAGALVSRQIELVAGEVKVTAAHILAAVKAADEVIARIAEVRAKLKKVGALVDFLGAVLTGNGKVILQAAVTLKGQLADG